MLTLDLAATVAAEIFDYAEHNYDYNLQSYGYVIMYKEEVAVENSSSGDMMQLKDLFFRVQFKMEPDENNEPKIESLTRVRGNSATVTLAQLKAHYAHPHFRDIGQWSEVCYGATELNEFISAMRHGDKMDEDSWYFVCHMLNELLHTESEEGGPYHYMYEVRDEEEKLERWLSSIEGENELTFTEGQFYEFWDHNSGDNIMRPPYNRYETDQNSFNNMLEEGWDDEIKQLYDDLMEHDLIQKTGSFPSNYQITNLGKFDALQNYVKVQDQLIRFRDHYFEEVLIPKFDYDPYLEFRIYVFVSYASEIGYEYYALPNNIHMPFGTSNVSNLEPFKKDKIFLNGKFFEKKVTDEDRLPNEPLNYKTKEIEYHEFTAKILHLFTEFLNWKENQLNLDEVTGYAQSLVTEARS